MADAELERLRAEVRKLRQRSTKKAGRLRREKGVQLQGSKYDPRRAVGAEKRLNRNQLNSYISRLETFNSRGTQYGAIGAGVPVPQKKLDRFREAQSEFNRTRGRLGRNVSRVRVQGASETVGEASRLMVAGGRGYKSNSLLARSNLPASNIVNEKALDKFSRTFEQRASEAGQRRDLRKARLTLDRMAQFTQDSDRLRDRLKNLSDDQVLALYSDNQFMNQMALVIDSDKDMYQQDMPDDLIAQESAAINDSIDSVIEAV